MPDRERMPALVVLERTAGIQLHNRFLWLVCALALYLIGQLSFVQWQTGRQLGMPRFDTLDLMSLLMAIIEGGLFLCALLLALSTPQVRRSWLARNSQQAFSFVAAGVGGALILVLLLLVLLAPVLALHTYPELASEAMMHIPLMMLQRGMLVLSAVLIGYNFILLLRYVVRLPWWLAGMLGLAAYGAFGYSLTYASFHGKALERLNYVFYYNHLWKYFDWIPNLQLSSEFHNIQMPYYAYYLGAGAAAALVMMLLWIPGASIQGSREKPDQS
jgi:hypothetical protein